MTKTVVFDSERPIESYAASVDMLARSTKDLGLPYAALGLAGESGEVVDEIKKILRDGEITPKRSDNVFLELGDQLWYWFRVCDILGFDPKDVMAGNIKKLADRQKINAIIS